MNAQELRTAHWDLRWSLETGGISWEQAREDGPKGKLAATIEEKIGKRTGGLKGLEHALELLELLSREGSVNKVLDADGLAPSFEAAQSRGKQQARSFGSSAGGGGVSFADVHAKLVVPTAAAENVAMRTILQKFGDAYAEKRFLRMAEQLTRASGPAVDGGP